MNTTKAADLLALIARMQTAEEMGGMVAEDAIMTLNNLIESARQVTGLHPSTKGNDA